MASSNDVYNGYVNYYRLHMYSWIVSQDIAANTSLVRSQVFIESLNTWFSYTSTLNQSINGVAVLDNYTASLTTSPYSSLLVMDNAVVVPHNADGTKTIAVGATFYNPITSTLSISSSFTLDTIPRTSTPSWTGNFVANAAGNYGTVINTNRASSSFTHDITYGFGGASGTIGTGVGASVTWTPPTSLLAQIPNSTSGTGTITTVTKSGSTTIGSVTQNFTLVADADIVPSISGITWTDTNATVVANIGAYVQNVSTVKGVISSAGVQGSSITSERITIGGTTVDENVPVLITSSGTITSYGIATDSRGRSTQYNSNISALAYTVPTINSWQVRRANSSGAVDEVAGTYLRMDLNAVVSSLIVSSTQKNAMTIQVRTRPTGGAWTSRNTITPGLTYNTNVLITGGGVYNLTNSYEVEITVSDKTGATSAKVVATIATATVTLDLNGSNVGIGKYHTQGKLDVNGDIYGSNINGATITGSTLTSTGAVNGTSASITGTVSSWSNSVAGGSNFNVDENGATIVYQPTTTIANTGQVNTLQVQGNNGGDAFMTFHIAGDYAAHFGLNGSTNDLAYGGWSAGANRYKVHHDGNSMAPYRMAAGAVGNSAGSYVTATFPAGRFTTTPILTITPVSQPNGNVTVPYTPGTLNSTSFTVGGFTLGGALVATNFHWHAVQMTSGSASG